jgi:hypothetical protein
MSNKKHWDVFKRYVSAIEKLGPKFDFYKMAKPLEKALESEGLNLKANEYFAKIFDMLDDPKEKVELNWDDELKPFFGVLPDDWKRRKVTDEMVRRFVPPSDWDMLRDSSWIRKSNQAVSSAELAIEVTKKETDEDAALKVFNIEIKTGDLSYLLPEDVEDIDDLEDAFYEFNKDLESAIKDPLWSMIKKYPEVVGLYVNMWSSPGLEDIKNAHYSIELTLELNSTYELDADLQKTIKDFFASRFTL